MRELFKNRRSIRKYLDKPVEDEKIHEMLCAGMVAPSGCNTRGYDFIVVKEKSTLIKLGKVGKYGGFIGKCGVAIVIVADEYTWWNEDCALAAGNILLEAPNQDLGGCWVEGKNKIEGDTIDREKMIRDILGVPDDKRVLCTLAIGYPDESPKMHSEEEYNIDKVHFEKF